MDFHQKYSAETLLYCWINCFLWSFPDFHLLIEDSFLKIIIIMALSKNCSKAIEHKDTCNYSLPSQLFQLCREGHNVVVSRCNYYTFCFPRYTMATCDKLNFRKYQQPKEVTCGNVHLMCSKNQNRNIKGILNQFKMRQFFPSILFCWHSVIEKLASPLLSWMRFVENCYIDKWVLIYNVLWNLKWWFSQ